MQEVVPTLEYFPQTILSHRRGGITVEYISKYGKAIATGGFVLLWVLGAPSAASAITPSLDLFCDTFDGSVCITSNSHGSGDGTFFFEATDLTGSAIGSALGTGFINGTGVTDLTLTGELGGNIGDEWELTLDEVLTPGGNTTVFGSCVTAGNTTFFQNAGGGLQDTTTNSDFAFDDADPFIGTGGSFSPAATGAPEVDPTTSTGPLAMAVASLLVLADARRRRQAKSE